MPHNLGSSYPKTRTRNRVGKTRGSRGAPKKGPSAGGRKVTKSKVGEKSHGSQQTKEDYLSGMAARLKLLRDRHFPNETSTMASRIGVNRRRLNDWLAGRSGPSSESLAALASSTGCSVEWLLFGHGEAFPPIAERADASNPIIRQTRQELLAAVDHLALALKVMRPLLSDEERAVVQESLARLAPDFWRTDPAD